MYSDDITNTNKQKLFFIVFLGYCQQANPVNREHPSPGCRVCYSTATECHALSQKW